MKNLKQWAAIVAMTLGLAGAAFADDNTGTGTGGGNGKPPKPPKVEGGRGNGLEIPKIGVPSNANIPDSLKALITQYQDAAQKFAASQKELLAQLKGATDEQKQKLKETLKANRDTFLADTTQLRADIREQLRELPNTLKSSTPGAVDGGTDPKGKGGRKP